MAPLTSGGMRSEESWQAAPRDAAGHQSRLGGRDDEPSGSIDPREGEEEEDSPGANSCEGGGTGDHAAA